MWAGRGKSYAGGSGGGEVVKGDGSGRGGARTIRSRFLFAVPLAPLPRERCRCEDGLGNLAGKFLREGVSWAGKHSGRGDAQSETRGGRHVVWRSLWGWRARRKSFRGTRTNVGGKCLERSPCGSPNIPTHPPKYPISNAPGNSNFRPLSFSTCFAVGIHLCPRPHANCSPRCSEDFFAPGKRGESTQTSNISKRKRKHIFSTTRS